MCDLYHYFNRTANFTRSSQMCPLYVDFNRNAEGAQWLSGRMLDSRPKGPGFEPHRRHCLVILEQDTFILG